MAPPSSPIPPTLLTLRLSSPSFLETILTAHDSPVYSTETYGSTTSLSRCDSFRGLTLIANIHWPDRRYPHVGKKGKAKESSASPQIFINGSMLSEEDLLKRNRLNTSRKFRIPGHSHSLKWRRVDGVFQCTSSTGAPVAMFEPAILTARARLHMFVSTLSGLSSSQPQTQDGEVSSILVDYLLVTALLLLTHPEDWHGLNPEPPAPVAIPGLSSRTALPQLDIRASLPHSYPCPPVSRTLQTRGASSSTPVSPISSITSAVSDSSPYTPSQWWEPSRERLSAESCVHPRRSDASLRTHVDHRAEEIKEVVDYEAPPPYEEIQWTVRVHPPRRLRT